MNTSRKTWQFAPDECIIVHDILERNFLIGNKTKQKIIDQLIDKLNINKDKAEEIYNISNNSCKLVIW